MCVGRERELHTLELGLELVEIRLQALRGRGFLLLFYFLVAWLLGLRDMEGFVGFLI